MLATVGIAMVARTAPQRYRRGPRKGSVIDAISRQRPAAQADVALVIPAYNEERRIAATLDQIADFFTDRDLTAQIVVVDDGSRDDTRRIAELWDENNGHSHVRLDVIVLDHRGKGAAVRAGMTIADAPVIGYCDADRSAGPDAFAAVYDALAHGEGGGVDVAMGSRGMPDSVLPVRQPWYRESAGRVFNLVLRRFARVPYRDTQCGLKMFTGDAARSIFRHQRLDGFAFDAEVVVLAERLGFRVREVPITWSHAEESRVSLVRDSLRMLRDVLRIVRRLGRADVHEPGVPSAAAMRMMMDSEETHWWHVAKRELVQQLVAEHAAGGYCLDVGCGGGATVALVGESLPAFGVDLSAEALSHATSRGLRGLVRAEGARLPFADGSCGLALALDVIEHHPQPEQMLREMARVLSPGGIAIVTVPAFEWMWSHHDHVLGHYRRYTAPRLRVEAARAGFDVERISYFHSWLLPPAWLFRKVKALAGRGDSADDFAMPGPVDRLFSRAAATERKMLARRDLPFGLSVLAVLRKPVSVTEHGHTAATEDASAAV